VLIIALLLPAVQLLASAFTGLFITPSSRPGKDIRLLHLGKITLRSLIGAVIGILLMLPLLAKC
jgi:hypothetical protein